MNEFGKKLFSAIQITLGDNSHHLSSLWETSAISYVKCSNCKQRSEKTDLMTEINLCINNPFTKEKFSRLELSLLNTLKPEYLKGDNKYFCSNCNEKYEATKGVEYKSFPKVLLFSCGRFVFDLDTFQRVKVNDEFGFPMSIDMNGYLGGYDKVEEKLKKDMPQIFEKKERKLKKRVVKKRKDQMCEDFNQLHSKLKGKRFKNKKTSQFTRQFLRKTRNTRKKMNKFKKSFNSDAVKDEVFMVQSVKGGKSLNIINQLGDIQVFTSIKTEEKSNNSLQEQEAKQEEDVNKQNYHFENEKKMSNDRDSSNTDKEVILVNKIEIVQKIQEPEHQELNLNTNMAVKGEIQQELESIPDEDVKLSAEIDNSKKNIPKEVEEGKTLDKLELIKTQKKMCDQGTMQDSKEMILKKSQYEFQFEEMLKQGPYVYYLYAIFIHKGTAYEGHYYIYIKSFETNLWYLFDDSQVTEVNIVNLLADSFGGNFSHSNGYMLAYRQVEPEKLNILSPQRKFQKIIPELINETSSMGELENKTNEEQNRTPSKGKLGCLCSY